MTAPDSGELARRKHEAALVELRREHGPTMLTVAAGRFGGRTRVKNGHDAQEAVDQALAQFERAGFLDRPAEEHRGLLLHIVIRRAIDMTKSGRATDALPEHDHEGRLGTEDQLDRADDADEAARAIDELRDLLADLKPRQREAIDRCVEGEQSPQDAAKAMGVTDRRVLQLLDEGLGRLRRKYVARHPGDERDDTDHYTNHGEEKGGK